MAELDEIYRSIGRLEGKMDSLIESNENQFKGIQDQFTAQFKLLNDHQNDINEEKLWRAGITGKISVIAAVVGTLISIIIAVGKTFIDKILKQ